MTTPKFSPSSGWWLGDLKLSKKTKKPKYHKCAKCKKSLGILHEGEDIILYCDKCFKLWSNKEGVFITEDDIRDK